MDEYINRADLMERLTSSEMQANMRGVDGATAYQLFLLIVNDIPAVDVEEKK